MKITIVVDANPIISALIGGFSREVFFRHDFQFVTTEYTLNEVRKYLPRITEKSGITLPVINELLLLLPIKVIEKEEYSSFLPKATALIADRKDAEILALALAKGHPLWSNDQHFENIPGIVLLKTKDFV